MPENPRAGGSGRSACRPADEDCETTARTPRPLPRARPCLFRDESKVRRYSCERPLLRAPDATRFDHLRLQPWPQIDRDTCNLVQIAFKLLRAMGGRVTREDFDPCRVPNRCGRLTRGFAQQP